MGSYNSSQTNRSSRLERGGVSGKRGYRAETHYQKKDSEKQIIETLIDEEALLLTKFLRKEQEIWRPRI